MDVEARQKLDLLKAQLQVMESIQQGTGPAPGPPLETEVAVAKELDRWGGTQEGGAPTAAPVQALCIQLFLGVWLGSSVAKGRVSVIKLVRCQGKPVRTRVCFKVCEQSR